MIVGKDVEKTEPSFIGSRTQNGADTLEDSLTVPQRVKHKVTLGPSNSTLRCVLLTHFSCAQLFVTLWTIATRLLCPWDSPGQNTGVGCRALPEGFIPYSQILPKVNENIEHTSTKSLYINVHNSIIHNNHKMQITQMPIKWHK